MMFGYGPMGLWGYVFGAISMVLFWGLVILAIIALVRYLADRTRPRGVATPPASAEQVLAERYARGEIDETEYRRRLDTLRQHSTEPNERLG
jgi:putative membrane protein